MPVSANEFAAAVNTSTASDAFSVVNLVKVSASVVLFSVSSVLKP